MFRVTVRLVIVQGWLALFSFRAAAAEPTSVAALPRSSASSSEKNEPSPTLKPGERRPVPDYDGRAEDRATVGEALLWVPRVALSPLYVVSEYVVRRPLGYVATAAERGHWPALLIDFFTFGPEQDVGIVPTGLIDFGFRPSVGLYFFSDDTFVDDNDIRLRAAYGGDDWRQFTLSDRFTFSSGRDLSFRAEYLLRPDWVFYGFGPEAPERLQSRFLRQEWAASLRYHHEWWRSSAFDFGVSVRDVGYDLGARCCEGRSVQRRVFDGELPTPPGAQDGFVVLTSDLVGTADSRERRQPEDLPDGSDFVSPSGTGAKVSLRARHNIGLDDRIAFPGETPRQYHWVNFGATLAGFADMTGQQRTLGLSLVADFTEPLSRQGAVPFDEVVGLGGSGPLSGFLEGRLRGRSAVAALMTYSWPIWVWLDGTLHYGVGNVFAPDLKGFELAKLRNSVGIGIGASNERDHAFQLLVAVGTETIENGMAVESLRLVFGTTNGF